MNYKETRIYEILVPACDNNGQIFPMPHHWEWDRKVQEIAGGLTLLDSVKGKYLNRSAERMIPVRIAATYSEMSEIVEFTIDHYQQDAILFYLVSERAIIATK